MQVTFRPIAHWPGELTHSFKRKTPPFRAGYDKTLKDLAREVGHLRGSSVVLQLALNEFDFRVSDGMPKVNSRVRHPGVILSFNSKHGSLMYPCDTYTDWTANLRAIVLSLECLRRVDRYGVTARGEQYTGWIQLPEPEPEDPAEFLAKGTPFSAAAVRSNPLTRRDAYYMRAKALHPDRGGSTEAMQRLNQAFEELGR